MYESEALGYIVADHQTRNSDGHDSPSVITYYLPFDKSPEVKRRELLEKGHSFWVNEIMKDLWQMHPGLKSRLPELTSTNGDMQ